MRTISRTQEDINKIVAVNTMTAHPHMLPDGTTINVGTGNRDYVFVHVPKPADGQTSASDRTVAFHMAT